MSPETRAVVSVPVKTSEEWAGAPSYLGGVFPWGEVAGGGGGELEGDSDSEGSPVLFDVVSGEEGSEEGSWTGRDGASGEFLRKIRAEMMRRIETREQMSQKKPVL